MFDYGENMTVDQVFLLISNRASKIMVAFMDVFLQIQFQFLSTQQVESLVDMNRLLVVKR
jgi:hypothetical protein